MRVRLITAVLALCCGSAEAEIHLAPLFTDHMVMQQDKPVPVWGTAEPGEEISVAIGKQKKTTTADLAGQWMLRLDAMSAGDPAPLKMIVRGRSESREVADILIGEVWYCSGQSNMWWAVSKAHNGEAEVLAANHPQIRLFTVPQKVSATPLTTMEQAAGWKECSPQTVGSFSAVAYYFGRALHQKLKVPVGLVHASWGGTLVASWTAMPDLQATPEFAPAVKAYEQTLARFQSQRAKGVVDEDGRYVDPGIQPSEKGWEKADLDDSAWKEMPLPLEFDNVEGKLYIDGAVWFRKHVEIPADWKGDLELRLEQIKNYDITWFNGIEVGRRDAAIMSKDPAPSPRRAYRVPASLVKRGRNTIAIRVFNTSSYGGIMGFGNWGNPVFAVRQSREGVGFGDGVSLAGPWKYKVGISYPQMSIYGITRDHRLPSALFNGMVNPAIPFAIRGVIWYQGESDGPLFNQQEEALAYKNRFQAMIRGWRRAWGQGDFPFLFVQLASFGVPQKQPRDGRSPSDAWALLRESQAAALALPNTAMTVAIDVGDARNVHPPRKQEVGARLCRSAICVAYAKTPSAAGPTYKSATVSGSAIRISFDDVGTGLEARDGDLRRFAIAGEDRRFVWADAVIEGDTVVVSSSQVPRPVAVRYAWEANPEGCNLYNKEGLPAPPFRTDSWCPQRP